MQKNWFHFSIPPFTYISINVYANPLSVIYQIYTQFRNLIPLRVVMETDSITTSDLRH
jgi:hypothetical protein